MHKSLLTATALVSSALFLVPGAQAFDWDGPYVGGVIGVVKSTGEIDWNVFDSGDFYPYTFEFDGTGLLIGVTSGINFTLDDKYVVGIEGDASLAFLKSEGVFDDFDYGEFEEELHSLLTLRGRAGVLSDDKDTYFFVTGGLAGGHVTANAYIEASEGGGEIEPIALSGFVFGVIGGVGVEHAITEDITVKGEILAYKLGSLSGSGYAGKGEANAVYQPSGFILRTGINFHF